MKDLLKICIDKTTTTDFAFIHSDYISTILKTYEPFYEFVRYPVQNVRPKDGIYCMFYPSGIEVLDYFVYKMKEIFPKSKNNWNILKDGLMDLQLCQMKRPDFYSEFKKNNINFK